MLRCWQYWRRSFATRRCLTCGIPPSFSATRTWRRPSTCGLSTSQKSGTVPTSLYFMRTLHVTEIRYLPYLRHYIPCGLCKSQKSGTVPTSLYFMRTLYVTEIWYRYQLYLLLTSLDFRIYRYFLRIQRWNSWTSVWQKTRVFCFILFTVLSTGGF